MHYLLIYNTYKRFIENMNNILIFVNFRNICFFSAVKHFAYMVVILSTNRVFETPILSAVFKKSRFLAIRVILLVFANFFCNILRVVLFRVWQLHERTVCLSVEINLQVHHNWICKLRSYEVGSLSNRGQLEDIEY